jgi:hypothetical protein
MVRHHRMFDRTTFERLLKDHGFLSQYSCDVKSRRASVLYYKNKKRPVPQTDLFLDIWWS